MKNASYRLGCLGTAGLVAWLGIGCDTSVQFGTGGNGGPGGNTTGPTTTSNEGASAPGGSGQGGIGQGGIGQGGIGQGGIGQGGATGDSVCGNGLVEGAEGCDDGNSAAGDACSADCVPTEWEVASAAGDATSPYVISTSFDGGNGFLTTWHDSKLLMGMVAVPVSSKGAQGSAKKIISTGDWTPRSVAMPNGSALLAQRENSFTLHTALIDSGSLELIESDTVNFSGSGEAYELEIAANSAGQVAALNRGPWDDISQTAPVIACLFYPSQKCFQVSVSPSQMRGSMVADGEEFVTAAPLLDGFDMTLFGPSGVLIQDFYPTTSAPFASDLVRSQGGFVLVWEALIEGCIRVQQFDFNLVPTSGPQNVPGTCAGNASGPRVSAHSNGKFVITFVRQGESASAVSAVLFGADGTSQGAPFDVNDSQDGYRDDAAVAVNPKGDVMVVWRKSVGQKRSIQGKLLPGLLK